MSDSPTESAFRFTGDSITTITSSPKLALDDRGDSWFVKEDHTQGLQIEYLRSLELPVPELVFVDDARIATRDHGQTLTDALRGASGDEEQQIRLLSDAGELLATVHQKLRFFDEVDGVHLWMLGDSSTTANAVTNFAHRFIEQDSSTTNAMLDGEIPEQVEDLRGQVVKIADLLLGYVSDEVYGDVFWNANQVAYGDYKPDNILLDHAEGRYYLIDPLLHRGMRIGDVAKFCTRAVIEPEGVDSDILDSFTSSYMTQSATPVIDSRVLFVFSALDTVNIISSYLGRVAKGDLSFRIVERLVHDPMYIRRLKIMLDETHSKLQDLTGVADEE